jgi:chorismate-pyruvate lyase
MAESQHTLDAVSRATDLIRAFPEAAAGFGTLRPLRPDDLPEPYRDLLDHRSHMTVAMERMCGGPVSLEVVATRIEPPAASGKRGRYMREILLASASGAVVQQGIVRIDLDAIDGKTAAAILAAKIPLGRILIEANLLRDVHDVALLEVAPGPHLRRLFGPAAANAHRMFGRVAEISLGGRPAVELLEIAAPGLLPKTLR